MDPTSELVRRCRSGDSGAFDGLVRTYMNTVLGLAYNYVGNFHTAEDLAQETFVQAFQSLDRLRDIDRFKVWLLRIARNKCIDHIRRNPKWISIDDDDQLRREVDAASAQTSTPPPSEASVSEAALLSVLQSIRADYREIFTMKHIDNLSYKEISQLLGMSVTAVGEKLYRVRAIIRERLRENPGSDL